MDLDNGPESKSIIIAARSPRFLLCERDTRTTKKKKKKAMIFFLMIFFGGRNVGFPKDEGEKMVHFFIGAGEIRRRREKEGRRERNIMRFVF